MAYCVKADLESAYTPQVVLELTDDNNDGTGDDDLITTAVEYADAEIDSALGVRYDVPFTAVPTLVKLISVRIAAALLTSRRRKASQSILVDAGEARTWLKEIASGDRVLADATADSTVEPYSTTEDEQPEFRRTRTDEDGNEIGYDGNLTW